MLYTAYHALQLVKAVLFCSPMVVTVLLCLACLKPENLSLGKEKAIFTLLGIFLSVRITISKNEMTCNVTKQCVVAAMLIQYRQLVNSSN
jgi:hypothetical protein